MAQGRKTHLAVLLTPEERQELESWLRSTAIRHGQAKRARIILMLADGAPTSRIAKMVGIARGPIYKWAKRFEKAGLPANEHPALMECWKSEANGLIAN
jgi:hypothetical protein